MSFVPKLWLVFSCVLLATSIVIERTEVKSIKQRVSDILAEYPLIDG